jgi:hypothetical protein
MTVVLPFDEAERLEQQRLAEVRERKETGGIVATPYSFRSPSSIPRREWLFGRHAIRKFTSATVAAGGTGKTALAIAEQLALASGRNLLDDHVRSAAPCWYIGLEDPLEEYERRVAAACLHYQLGQEDFRGGFYLDSGRTQDFVIAREGAGGVVIAQPIVTGIIRQIQKLDIALVTVDPFVASHTVRENDNGAIEVVARTWAYIADQTGAAIELVHHVRKGSPGQELSADDARGARALVDKARSVRMLTPMTQEEALKAGVDERRRFFKVSFGKANLFLPPDTATWRQLTNVSLGNGGDGPDDEVGVATPWEWPNPLDEVTAEDLNKVQAAIASGSWRASSQAARWAGRAVAEVLGYDIDDEREREQVKSLLKIWLKSGALKLEVRKDEASRKEFEFVVVGQS